jgi:hypothetical protein
MSSSHLFGDPRLRLLAASEQFAPHAVSSHKRRDALGRSCEVVRPGQPDVELSAIPLAGSSSGDVLAPDDVGDERQPVDQSVHGQKDQQKNLHGQGLTSRGTQGDHLSRNRACLAGYVPGATDGSMPAGSARLFIQLFYYYLNLCSFASPSPPCTDSRVSRCAHALQ